MTSLDVDLAAKVVSGATSRQYQVSSNSSRSCSHRHMNAASISVTAVARADLDVATLPIRGQTSADLNRARYTIRTSICCLQKHVPAGRRVTVTSLDVDLAAKVGS